MRTLPVRLALGALLAASLTACGGGSDQGGSPAPAEPEEEVTFAGNDGGTGNNGDGGLGGTPGNYLPGPEALSCTDRAHDVEIAKGRKAPAWADLQGVSWERSGQRVIVAFQLAVKVPQTGPAAFTTTFRSGARTATARIALDGRVWRVTVGGKMIDGVVQPVVKDLVVQLPVELGGLDLNRRVSASAAATGRIAKTGFTDPACATGLTWKVPASPSPSASPRPSKSAKRASTRPSPVKSSTKPVKPAPPKPAPPKPRPKPRR